MIFTCLRSFFRVYNSKMMTEVNRSIVTFLPDNLRGMKHLDREKFTCDIKVAVLKLSLKNISKVLGICKSYLLKLERFKALQCTNEDDQPLDRIIHFNPHKVMCWTDISEEDRVALTNCDITENNLDIKQLRVTYENLSFDEIFSVVLPHKMETVSGFSQVGHIIHLNLRDHLLEYKNLIGTVLVDKIKTCRTVVNKLKVIDNKYRNFEMEVIAGDEDFFVTVKEHNCSFQFDFSKVYWNSRLGKEHGRVLDCLKQDDVLFDVFCGVGPFAIPAAKRKCRVFANDLNPDSYHWLNHNAVHNKIKTGYFKSYNLDGKDFICTIFKDFLKNCCEGKEAVPSGSKIHVTMNLPAMAVNFLKYFKGLLGDIELSDKFNFDIIVYVYCFAIGETPMETAKQMVIDNMQQDVSSDILNVFDVRNVSPKKEMMRVTLRLSKEILFSTDSIAECTEPPVKRVCVESVTTPCRQDC